MRIPQFNLPSFTLSVAGSSRNPEIGIPESYLAEPINCELDKYEGIFRDTELEKIEIDNLVFSFREGGFALKGSMQTQFRKILWDAPLIGATYTPWISVDGSFIEELAVDVVDGKLTVSHSQLNSITSDDWHSKLVNEFVLPYLKQEVIKSLNQLLANFNGMTLEELFLKYSQAKLQHIVDSRGLSEDSVDRIFNLVRTNARLSESLQRINKRLGLVRINARFSKEHLWLSVVPVRSNAKNY